MVFGGEIKKGFTLIELSLSLLFIGLLSLAIVLIISNTISSYQRGLTLNRVNSTGSYLVNDMREAVQSSSARSLISNCALIDDSNGISKCESQNADRFVYFKRKDRNDKPYWGIFCTGTYSYLWNSIYADSSNKLKIVGENNNTLFDDFRLIKIKDDTRAICKATMIENNKELNYDYDKFNGSININVTGLTDASINEGNNVVDLLDKNSGLAIFDLSVDQPAISLLGDNVFYSISFVLGTVSGDVNIKATGNYCGTPEGDSSVSDYCSINKFSFSVQVNGG